MKNILIFLLLVITFMACGGDSSNSNEMINEKKSLGCSDIYTEEYVKSKFSDIEEIKYLNQSSTCGYFIKTKSETYNTFYTVSQNATEQMLTQSLSYFSGAKALPELGEYAYIYSVGGIQQITLLDNGNLISAYIWLSSNTQFDKERTKELIRDMNKKLKQNGV